jgi:hypothetical protein
MQLDELQSHHPIPSVLDKIVAQVGQATQKEIDFRLKSELDVRARTKIARTQMSHHIISLNPKESQHFGHIIAHECGHILHMAETPPEERVVPLSTSNTMRVAADDIRAEADFLPLHLRRRMIELWMRSLIQQVYSQPIDVRIETWLHNQYAVLRSEQRHSLEADVATIRKVLSREVRRATAPIVFKRSNAMNYAYLKHLGPILDRSFEKDFREYPDIVDLGETLSEILTDESLSDVELINAWAQTLDIQDWFVWRGFEDMPASYYAEP